MDEINLEDKIIYANIYKENTRVIRLSDCVKKEDNRYSNGWLVVKDGVNVSYTTNLPGDNLARYCPGEKYLIRPTIVWLNYLVFDKETGLTFYEPWPLDLSICIDNSVREISGCNLDVYVVPFGIKPVAVKRPKENEEE
jgi:hypothetical protein